jgi:GNAT superfamily N-acetyltransferase
MPVKYLHLPSGYALIPVRTTYLEMKARPAAEPIALPDGCTVERWLDPEPREYRELFSAVGGAWGWSGRLIMAEGELTAVIRARTTEIYRLRRRDETAGFLELDRCRPREPEIAYFGLLPGFIGRGLGGFLLNWAIHRAWREETERVWLHTCQYDHPQALSVYIKAGFSVYEERVEMQPYAEEFIRNFPRPGG